VAVLSAGPASASAPTAASSASDTSFGYTGTSVENQANTVFKIESDTVWW